MVTVYRTLDILEKTNLVCRSSLENGQTVYLLRRLREHHHHLFCSRCGMVKNIAGCGLEEMAKRVGSDTGFIVTSHTFELTGICPACQLAGNDISRVGE